MIFHLHETCLDCCTLVSFIIFPVCITPHIIIASARTHILIILCILQKNIYLHTANSTILVTILRTHFDIFSANPFTVLCAIAHNTSYLPQISPVDAFELLRVRFIRIHEKTCVKQLKMELKVLLLNIDENIKYIENDRKK